MKKFYWKDEYNLGIEKVDRQHRQLFEIINKLIERSAESSDPKLVSETLTEMLDYAKEHFRDEEAMMQEYGCPELERHKEQHAYFIRTTAELSINALNNQSMVIQEIVEFLKMWLTLHILKVDMKYKDLFKAKIPAKVS
ncbi:MAG: bacteriohemerythrin [Sedimentisphaerales bacterium]|jgi:hemerythrin